MTIYKFPENTSICENAYPLFLRGDKKGDKKCVLLIHGYKAYTGRMKYLGKELQKVGFSVSIPRLPGHGTNSMDFLNTTWKDWLRHCIDVYLDLKNQYEEIYVAGSSMGGLIAIILASYFNIKKLALTAPAIIISNKAIVLAPLIKFFIKKIKKKNFEPPAEENIDYLKSEYWQWHFPSAISNLLQLKKAANKSLKKNYSDTLIIVSKKDPTVPVKAANIIYNRIKSKNKKRIFLEKSSHIIVNGKERGKTAKAIIDWFTK